MEILKISVTKDKIKDFILYMSYVPFALGAVALCCFGFYILVTEQIMPWLKYGVWHPLPLLNSVSGLYIKLETHFDFLRELHIWIDNPTSWYGLHKIVYIIFECIIWLIDLFSVPIALFVMGLILPVLGIFTFTYLEDKWNIDTGGKSYEQQ